MGSTRFLTNGTGVVGGTYSYDAYGNLIAASGGSGNAYLFAGEQRDGETGLDYLRARYYDPLLGRFVSADAYEGTLDDPMSLHDYQYAHANPVVNTDPSGFITQSELTAIFKIIDILVTIANPDPLSIALLATPPGVPAGFVKGLNQVWKSVARGPLFARMAKGVANGAALVAKGEESALSAYNFLRDQNLLPFISDEYLQALKAPLPHLGKATKVVDFVAEGKTGLVLVEAKPKLTIGYIRASVSEGGKFAGTSRVLEEVYEKGGDAFPGIEKQIITSTDLSAIATTAKGRGYWKKPTGLSGEFQLYEGAGLAKPVKANGLPVFLQEVVEVVN